MCSRIISRRIVTSVENRGNLSFLVQYSWNFYSICIIRNNNIILKWINIQNNNVIRNLISIFQSSLNVICHAIEAWKSNISYRLHTYSLTYITISCFTERVQRCGGKWDYRERIGRARYINTNNIIEVSCR